jgi:hypothetical protein
MRRRCCLLTSILALLAGQGNTQLYAQKIVKVDGPGVDEVMNTRATDIMVRPQPWGGEPCLSSGLCRPSFLIIGAGKCGTSSVYYYLQDHPQGQYLPLPPIPYPSPNPS